MAKVTKSIRLDEETLERVRAYAESQGIKEGTAIAEAISAGLDRLQRGESVLDHDGSHLSGNDGAAAEGGGEASGLAADYIESLKAQIKTLENQLDVKDEQIAALNEQAATLQRLTDQAQKLHAVTEHKALETAEAKEEKRGGFWARIFGE